MQQDSNSVILCTFDSCLIYQHKNVKEIEQQLKEDFGNLCDCFIDNKLSIHMEEDKTKVILFASKYKSNDSNILDISNKGNKVKQYSSMSYLG